MYVSGHSYGASVPSLDMQRRMAQNPPAWRARQRRREEFELVAPLVLEAVHPANLGPLPPSPKVIVHKAIQLGLVKITDDCGDIMYGHTF